jgi:ankyrin repeat protein
MMRSIHLGAGWLVGLLVFAVCSGQAYPQNPGTKERTENDEVRALIDKLQKLGGDRLQDVPTMSADQFLALGISQARVLVLGKKPTASSAIIRELVKRGARAVPLLIAHLDDKRPTGITIRHHGGRGGMFFVDEYDFNRRTTKEPPRGVNRELGKDGNDRDTHTVTVGDLCFVVLGEIVNRHFNAVRYQMTGCIMINSPTGSDVLRVAIKEEWGGLTPARHKESLERDFLEPDSGSRRNEACLRLGYYYPEALEPLALKQLAAPRYDFSEVWDLIREKLYPAKDAKERKDLFNTFVAKRGDVARQAIQVGLFDDLDLQEADEGGRLSPPLEKKYAARACLVELFGYPNFVKSDDRPHLLPTSDATQARFIDRLVFFASAKIDEAARRVLRSTEDEYLALSCARYLVGRGADQAIQRYVAQRLPGADEKRRTELEQLRGRLGWTLLHLAAEVSDSDRIADLILNGADVNARAANGQTPLHVAAEHRRLEAVRVLLDRNADPNNRDIDGYTPARLAVDGGNVVELLLARGAVPSDILVASFTGRVDVVESSLAKDRSSVASRTRKGATSLHIAAKRGHAKVVEVLLAHGADVNATEGENKFTPLHCAAYYCHPKVVALLLAHKADRSRKVWEGKTPLDLARERDCPNGETSRLLKEER